MTALHIIAALMSTLVVGGVLLALHWGSRKVARAVDDLEKAYRGEGYSVVKRWRSLVMMGASLHMVREDGEERWDLHIGRDAIWSARPDLELLGHEDGRIVQFWWVQLRATHARDDFRPFAMRRRHANTAAVWKHADPRTWNIEPHSTGSEDFDRLFEILTSPDPTDRPVLSAKTRRALLGMGADGWFDRGGQLVPGTRILPLGGPTMAAPRRGWHLRPARVGRVGGGCALARGRFVPMGRSGARSGRHCPGQLSVWTGPTGRAAHGRALPPPGQRPLLRPGGKRLGVVWVWLWAGARPALQSRRTCWRGLPGAARGLLALPRLAPALLQPAQRPALGKALERHLPRCVPAPIPRCPAPILRPGLTWRRATGTLTDSRAESCHGPLPSPRRRRGRGGGSAGPATQGTPARGPVWPVWLAHLDPRRNVAIL